MLQLKCNPWLTLTGFRTTRPRITNKIREVSHFILNNKETVKLPKLETLCLALLDQQCFEVLEESNKLVLRFYVLHEKT